MQRICLRNSLAALTVAGIFSSGSVLANDEWLITAGYALAPAIQAENGEKATMIPVWFAVPEAFDYNLGGYVRFGLAENDLTGSNSTDRHVARVINLGLTYKASDHVIFYAGPGYSYQRSFVANTPSISKHRFNTNVGVAIVPGNFGINISYDSGPNAFGVGFTVSSNWFGGRF